MNLNNTLQYTNGEQHNSTVHKISPTYSTHSCPIVSDTFGRLDEFVIYTAAVLVYHRHTCQYALFTIIADANHLAIHSYHLCHSTQQ